MMSENKKLVPKRRFKEFQNASVWEQETLGNVADIYDGTHQTPKYTDSGVMFLSVENIKSLTSEKYISQEAFESEFKVRPERNDVLMTRIGDIGTANVVQSDEDIAYYVSLALLKPTKIDAQFLATSIATPFVKDGLWKRTLHIAFPKKINKNEIAKVEINVPNIEEQKKMGEFFTILDKSITLHQRKLEKTKALKAAYLSELFPAEGERKPKRRFKGFTDAWEQRKLGEITKLSSSKRVHRKDYVESGVPFFRGLEISKLGRSSKLEDILYVSEEYYAEIKGKYGVPQIGDILITAVGTLGNSFLVRDNTPFYFKDGNLIWLSDIQIKSDYLEIYLGDGIGKKRVLDSAAGSNQKALTMVKLQNVQVSVPNNEEQTQISMFFQNFDHHITLHQRKLKKLQNIKTAYLNELFVGGEQ